MDNNDREERIWYHDLNWSKKQQESGEESTNKFVELVLSDQKRVSIEIDTLEKLQGLIDKLENSI